MSKNPDSNSKPEGKSHVKADLTILLKAGDTIVAESTDPVLWQQTLGAITGTRAGDGRATPQVVTLPGAVVTTVDVSQAVASLAREIDVQVDVVQGAICPSGESPFLHIDVHCWSAWSKHIPSRGPGSVSPAALGATLLALWFRHAKLKDCTIEKSQKALAAANIPSTNPNRSIRNCRWLQLRGASDITINPSRIADAIAVTKAFCTRAALKLEA